MSHLFKDILEEHPLAAKPDEKRIPPDERRALCRQYARWDRFCRRLLRCAGHALKGRLLFPNRLALFCVGESPLLAFALRRWLPYRVSRDADAFSWRLHYPLDLEMSYSDFRDEVYNTPLVRLTLVYRRETQTVEFLVVTEDYEEYSVPADKKALTHVLRENIILPYLAFHYGAKEAAKGPAEEEAAVG
jgi:hypothetical protein